MDNSNFVKLAACICLSITMAGCAQLAQQAAVNELRQDISALQASLANSGDQLQGLEQQNREVDTTLMHQLNNLNSSVNTLSDQVNARCGQPAPAAASCPETPAVQKVLMNSDNKMVVGEVERVWLEPPGLSVTARIDTGASSSSLHAENVTEFERDGEDWVRFDVTNGDQTVSVERRVKRHVRVYQQADKDGTRRPVVDMRTHLGDVQETFEFTLADRSHLEHGMILGRNFLTDVALVDVGQQFVQPAHEPENGSP